MKSKKRFAVVKAIENLITELNSRLVIVEGKRDVRALEMMGVRVDVITLDQLACRKVDSRCTAVILTDFDRAGDVKMKKATSILIDQNVKIDAPLRQHFKRLFGVLTIEEAPHIFNRLLLQYKMK